MSDLGVWRMLDASLNRAAEGLRTVEEVARFVLDDANAASQLKSLRHQMTRVASSVPRQRLLAARDTAGDVGIALTGEGETSRQSTGSVVAAAASRTLQSLRVIEEVMKIDAVAREVHTDSSSELVNLSPLVEAIRYRCYDVFATVEKNFSRNPRQERLAKSVVYGIIDAGDSQDDFAVTIRRLITAGVTTLQLRDRNVTDRILFERAVIGSRLTRQQGGIFIVNDRADIAAAADADGVHVGQDELPVDAARRIVGPSRLVGLSTHDIQQVCDASSQPIDYIGCGPIFPSKTKAFDSHTGTAWLTNIAEHFAQPAFAIGGIDHSNVDQIADAGVFRIAISAALGDAPELLISKLTPFLEGGKG